MVEKKTDKKVIMLLVSIVIGVFVLSLIVGRSIDGLSTPQRQVGVQVIEINGEISTNRQSVGLFATGQSSKDIVRQINEANSNNNVKAVLFRINSPGGTPVASHEIVRAIKDLDKPSVSVIRDVGASGAYWVASATDFIVSDELSMTGSVGVIGGFFDIHGLLDRYNISYETFTGGEFKDLGSSFRPITEVERDLLQGKVDMMHSFFLEDVVTSRNLSEDQVRVVGTGIYFIGLEAYDVGLVDMLGSESHAVLYLQDVFNTTNVRLIERQERAGLLGSLAGLSLPSIGFGPSIKLR